MRVKGLRVIINNCKDNQHKLGVFWANEDTQSLYLLVFLFFVIKIFALNIVSLSLIFKIHLNYYLL